MRFTPRPDQAEAIDAIVDKLATESRTQAIMACGTGKTFVSQKAVEQVVADKADSLVLIAVPNLVLVEQMIGEWTRQAAPDHEFAALAVNSRRRGKADPDEITDVNLADVTSDPETIADFMLSAGRKVIFSTYQSMAHISTALELAAASRPGFQIDVMVLDEAHRTAGVRKSDTPTAFKLALDGEKVPVAKRLFMTATPRISNSKRDDTASASMDNPVLFGDRAITRSLSWAVTNELLAPYRTYVVQVDNAMLQGVLEANPSLRVGGQAAEAKHVAAAIALAKNAKLNGLGGIITYSSSIAGAKEFGRVLEEVVAALPADQKPTGKLTVSHINGGTPADERDAILGTLDSTGRAAGDWSVVTNCNCLVEGVNVPSMDAIMFVDPRKSIVSIVQAIGRPMRKDKNNPDKIATIVVPVFIGEYENAKEAVEDGAFESVGQTIAALRDVDDALSEKFVDHLVKRDADGVTVAGEEALPDADLSDTPEVGSNSAAPTGGDQNERRENLIAFTDSEGELHPGQPDDALIRLMDPMVSIVQREAAIRENIWADWHHALETTLVDDITTPWERALAALMKFVMREGHAKPARGHAEEGVRLGAWVSGKRLQFSKGVLEQGRVDCLEAIPGWTWDARSDTFDKYMSALRSFVKREGHALVGVSHFENGVGLGNWVGSQRAHHANGRLERWKIDLLEDLPGWSWGIYADAFDRGMVALELFRQREGHAKVPQDHVENGVKLGSWVSDQRKRYSSRTLSQSKIDRLEALQGWAWNALSASFEEGFAMLQSFTDREGHSRVANGHVENGFNLGHWVSRQRKFHAKGVLDQSKVGMLESVPGWTWSPLSEAFDEALTSLSSFVQREGHANVAARHVEGAVRLGELVGRWRTRHRNGKLDQNKIDRLDAIPGWTWSPLSDVYDEYLDSLRRFVNREGYALVPSRHVENGVNLGMWVGSRRKELKSGKLSEERIAKLDAISPKWRNDALAPWESAPGVRKLDEAA